MTAKLCSHHGGILHALTVFVSLCLVHEWGATVRRWLILNQLSPCGGALQIQSARCPIYWCVPNVAKL